MVLKFIHFNFTVEGGARSEFRPQCFEAAIEKGIKPRDEISCEIKYKDGSSKKIQLLCRIDTENEIEYYKNGGILQYVLRNMLN